MTVELQRNSSYLSQVHQIREGPKEAFDPKVDPRLVDYLLAATGFMGEKAEPRWLELHAATWTYLSSFVCPPASYWRMMVSWTLAQTSKHTDRNEYLWDAEARAAEVLSGCKDETQLDNARKVLEGVRSFRSRSTGLE
jgi:hypothetical protein